MKHACLVLVVVGAGCLGPNVATSQNASGAPAHDLGVAGRPPKPTPAAGGGQTAGACDGVTDKGRCELTDQGQVAVTCDIAANRVERVDCSAIHKVCVIDSARGARCATLPPPTTSGGSDGGSSPPAPSTDMARPSAPGDLATAPPMCASGVDYRGYCASASNVSAPDTAIWCDPSTGETIVVDCAATGQTCQIDVCADGAYCCDAPAPLAPDMI